MIHPDAGAPDEDHVVDVQLGVTALRRVPDHRGAVAVPDHGGVRVCALVGGVQPVLEAAQVRGRVLGVVFVGRLTEVLRGVVADPADGGVVDAA